jgi:hypothetical protein
VGYLDVVEEYVVRGEKMIAWDIYEVIRSQFADYLEGCYARRLELLTEERILKVIDHSEYNGYQVQEIEYIPLSKVESHIVIRPIFVDDDGIEMSLATIDIVRLRNRKCYYEIIPNSRVVKMIAKELYGE